MGNAVLSYMKIERGDMKDKYSKALRIAIPYLKDIEQNNCVGDYGSCGAANQSALMADDALDEIWAVFSGKEGWERP